jgi:hypothetical protein
MVLPSGRSAALGEDAADPAQAIKLDVPCQNQLLMGGGKAP